MKGRLKILILVLLIIAVAAGICYMLFNGIRSIGYNKNANNPIVTLSIQEYGDVEIELYPEYAPNTVKQFVKLVENGFYDGKIFHGTDGNAVNGGMKLNEDTDNAEESSTEESTDSNTEGEEEKKIDASQEALNHSYYDSAVEVGSDDDYEVTIEGEFVANGFDKNTLRFEKGVIGLYRNEYDGYGSDLSKYSYNSGSSLFFILTDEDSALNGMYTAFGKVTKGLDIIEKIKALPTASEKEEDGLLYFENYPIITSAKVETFGINYGEPKYMKAFDYKTYMTNLFQQYYSDSN